jgi:CRP/FNR family transcriptional regulator, cyclic AMP receptor protein
MQEERLKQVPLFASLSKKELRQLARVTDQVDVPEGDHLAKQGDFAYEFFVIEQGTAEVTQGGQKIRELAPGDFFGEIGLLDSERRTASVVATSPMTLIVIAGWDFRAMESEMPRLALKVRQALLERVLRDLKERS